MTTKTPTATSEAATAAATDAGRTAEDAKADDDRIRRHGAPPDAPWTAPRVRPGDVVTYRIPRHQEGSLARAALVVDVHGDGDPFPQLDLQVLAKPGDGLAGSYYVAAVACDPSGTLARTWSPR